MIRLPSTAESHRSGCRNLDVLLRQTRSQSFDDVRLERIAQRWYVDGSWCEQHQALKTSLLLLPQPTGELTLWNLRCLNLVATKSHLGVAIPFAVLLGFRTGLPHAHDVRRASKAWRPVKVYSIVDIVVCQLSGVRCGMFCLGSRW